MTHIARRAEIFGLCTVLSFACVSHAGDRDVTVPTDEETVVLAGTLSMPDGMDGDDRVPAVVLLSGSGPQDRDSALVGRAPFRVLADVFVSRGYAVLRCDDRGVGGSSGERAGATVDDFVDDARGMVAFVSGLEGVDASSVFVLGHSEGAGVATELAAADDRVSGGVVLLGGTAVPGHAVLTDQAVRMLEASGVTDRSEAVRTAHSALMRALGEAATEEEAIDLTVELIDAQTGGALPEAFARAQAEQAVTQFDDPWFVRFLSHDPSVSAGSMGVAGLAVFGGLDQQVSDELNVSPMADALRRSGHPLSRVVVLPGHNHLFQVAETGAFAEYATLDDLDPGVAHLIADWMDSVVSARDE